MLIMSRVVNRAIDDSSITAVYVGKSRGKYVVTAQIDTQKANLPNSFYSLPIRETETRAEAAELLRVMVESLNRKL